MKIKLFSKKMSLLLSIVVMISLVLSGCGGNAGQTAKIDEEKPKIAFYAYNSEPVVDWDPSIGTSNELTILHNVYETLLRYDGANHEIIKVLAEDYTKSDDGLKWTFKIRKGVKFHDSTDVNAEAVKFSIDRTMEINRGAAYIWSAVKEIKLVDEYTVDFILKYPAPLDIIASAAYGAFIMSPTAIKSHDAEWLSLGNDAGSGPYFVESSKMGEEVILTKFEGYWGGWEGNHIDKVVMKKFPETSSRRQLIEKGEASVTIELPSEDLEALKQNPNVNIITGPTFTNLLIHMNTKVEPMNNKLVRQALSYAFPYEDVMKYATGGYSNLCKGAIPEGIMGYSDSLFQYTYDIEKAKELLTQAGYTDGGFKLLYTYMAGDEVEKKTGELYKAELKKLNIELEMRGMPWDSYLELSRSKNPKDRQDLFAVYWWPDYVDPYTWFFNMYHSADEVYWNQSDWVNKDFDKLIDEANIMAGVDKNKAEQMYIDAQKMLIEEAPSLFTFVKRGIFITKNSFKGVNINPAYEQVVFFYDTFME